EAVQRRRADGALELRLGDLPVGALVDPGGRGRAVAALGEMLDGFAQCTGEEAADAGRAHAAEDAPQVGGIVDPVAATVRDAGGTAGLRASRAVPPSHPEIL